MAVDADYIGEVIESSTAEFTAESRELHSPPSFGSFVRISLKGLEDKLPAPPPPAPTESSISDDEDPFMNPLRRVAGTFGSDYRSAIDGEPAVEVTVQDNEPAIYAIVHQATTAPVDSSRRLRAYWKGEDQLAEEQPELSEWMLVTHFRAIIIGYSSNGSIKQYLPPQPPKILARVDRCTNEEIRSVTSRMDFLRTLTNFCSTSTEEVVAACIREAYAARSGDYDFLVSAGKELANLLRDDYDRLQAIMRRVEP